jgi:predicted TPR repeat methyltransferase
MSFPWLHATPPRPGGADRRASVAIAELASRAGVLYRLGFSQAAATSRLAATVAWEYDPESQRGAHRRPAALSDPAIAKIVSDVYARRPS